MKPSSFTLAVAVPLSLALFGFAASAPAADSLADAYKIIAGK